MSDKKPGPTPAEVTARYVTAMTAANIRKDMETMRMLRRIFPDNTAATTGRTFTYTMAQP